MKTTYLILFLLISGCDYIPRTVFEIETINGKIIKLSCPIIDEKRNILTYFHAGNCIVSKDG